MTGVITIGAMMRQPIDGPRLRLAPFTAGHITDAYLGWLSDRNLMRYSSQSLRTHTVATSRAYLAGFDWKDSFFWAIKAKEQDCVIGTLSAYVDERSAANIGILVGDPRFRGRGYANEAWGLAMSWLFDVRGVSAIEGGTDSRNKSMMAIFHRQGMAPTGQTASALSDDAVNHHFRLERDTWLHRRT